MAKTKKQPKAPTPLLMVEGYWMNTPLSVARHFGRIQYNKEIYIIVDKLGRDLWECTEAAEREGREMAIDQGEPADLIWIGLQKHYKRLKRDRIIQLIKEGKTFEEIAKTK